MAAAGLEHSPSASISVDTLPETAQENYLDFNTIKGAVAHTQASHNKAAEDGHYSVSLPKAIKDRHHELADDRVQCVETCKTSFHHDDQLEGENEDAMLVSGADEGPPREEPPQEAHEPADAQVVPLFDPSLDVLNALPKPTKEMILPRLKLESVY